MSTTGAKTLRLNMPQWQGGNVHDYYLGSKLLSWLAPPATGPEETVYVPEPQPGETLELENGMLGRAALIAQAQEARRVIEKHAPDRIVTFGGDCLIDLAPMAYLNKRYGGNLGVLWVDAHPDILTPQEFVQGNTYVLAALLGRGESDLLDEVDVQVKPGNVMYAGLNEWAKSEDEVINQYGLRHASASELATTSKPILDWIAAQGITHIAVHFDVDVLDPAKFGPTLLNDPYKPEGAFAGIPRGRMLPAQVVRLLKDVAAECDLVGLAIAEFLPWEAITTRNLLRDLPLIGG